MTGDQNVIAGNYIGTDVTGVVALGNLGSAIYLIGDSNRIGTNADGNSDVEERNVISGNGREGIRIFDSNNIVAGNFIGVDASGSGAMGNGVSGLHNGVTLGQASSGNRVGSDIDGVRDEVEANVIANNPADGIAVFSGGINNTLRRNAIFSNGGLGIRVFAGSSYPTFTTIRSDNVITQVVGAFNSTPNTTFDIDFYASANAGPGGTGQAERYLASTTLTTDGSGEASFDLLLPSTTTIGEFVSATATDPQGFTSEFSAATLVSGPITFVVDSMSDAIDTDLGDGFADDGGGNATLRAAVMEANALAGDDTIQLPVGTFALGIAGTGEDAAATGDLDISSNITIVGAGQGVTIIDGSSLDRIFEVIAGGELTLQGLTLTGGSVVSGGAISVGEDLRLVADNVEFIGNTSNGSDGGAINAFKSTVEIANSTFTNNTTDQDAGAIGGFQPVLILVSNSTFTNNVAAQDGGAIGPNGGTLTIDGSTFTGNQAVSGAAIKADDASAPIVTISNSVFDSNINTSASKKTVSVFNASGFVMVTDTAITNNTGGGIAVGGVTGGLLVTRSDISGNLGVGGGGGGIESSRPVTIIDSTVSGNRGGFGGGIRNSSTTTIMGSTISGNTGTTYGGGILNSGPTYITNSTISSNISYGPGGGINTGSAFVSLLNSTVTNNTATTGGGIRKNSATVEIKNSIIAGNIGTSSDADLTGSGFTSLGNNLIGDIGSATGFTDGVNGDMVGDSAGSGVVNPLLGTLQDNGGETFTHLLMVGSLAIDTGTSSGAPVADQRGNPRPLDGDEDGAVAVDIGAVEFFDGFAVNTTADTIDANLGDGLAEDASGKTSLRAAVMEANALGGAHRIALGASTYTLTLTGAGEDSSATGDFDVAADITLVGIGADITIIDAAGLDRVFDVLSTGTLALSGIAIQSGNAGADDGGGIRNAGSLAVAGVHLTNNATLGDGGAIFSDSNLILNNSTISANTAVNGAGIYLDGVGSFTGNTLSGNIATTSGGGLLSAFSATATIISSTIIDNTALTGGGIYNSGGLVRTKNSIVADNTGSSADSDVLGPFTSLGHNLIGDIGSATGLIDGINGDQVGDSGGSGTIDPLLGILQNNGGATPTHLPQTASPAIDAGDNTDAPSTDQRGTDRILDGEPDGVATIDIGSVEVDIRGLNFVVDVFTDSVDDIIGDGIAQDAGGNTSLRAAIQEANEMDGFDTIVLGPGTYTLSLSGTGEELAASGDLDITDDLNLVGAGADVTILDASALGDRAFHLFTNTFAGFMGITITGGMGTGFGSNADGGGILNRGAVRIETSTLDNNTSANEGGGVRNLATGLVSIVDSTFSNNTARKGGGIHSEGAVIIISSTFSANTTSVGSGRRGGAIYQEAGSLALEASTLTENTADDEGGGLYVQAGTATAINTAIGANFSTSTSDVDLVGTFISLGNNLIGDIGSASGFIDGEKIDQVGDSGGSGAINPLLGPLQNNGGTTRTHAPMAGSPLIDAGNNTQARALDQRGLFRIFDGDGNTSEVVDIGSVEFLMVLL